jgi:hypothetical protein
MQQRFFTRTTTLMFAITAVVLGACSSDSTSFPPTVPAAVKTGASTAPGDTTPTPPTSTPPTSSGPVAAVVITPHNVMVPLATAFALSVTGFDASGVQVGGAAATFSSSDPSIVSIAIKLTDSVAVKAVALGTAKVYATINGHTDSTTITVVPATPPSATPTPTPPAPGVTSFDFNGTIVSQLAGSDTSKTAPVAGALVKLSRIGTTTGDTLSTSVDAGSATTDANGKISFKGLTGGAYAVDITPPSGSNLSAFRSGFGAPHDAVVNFTFKLFTKP